MNGLPEERAQLEFATPVRRDGESIFTAAPGARSAIVNRTHRVVRAQALGMRRRRAERRSLWLPVLLCSVLLLITCYGAWALLENADFTYNGVLDASYQTLIFLAWSFPVSILVGGLIWKQRALVRFNGDV